jgi:Zn-finger nucleic acid-binding protein
MHCPKCHQELEKVSLNDVKVSRCPECGGSWYDKDELRVLKDHESHGDYAWIDLDLWKDVDKFRARRQQRYSCPRDGQPMTTVHYGDSSMRSMCSNCEAVSAGGVPGDRSLPEGGGRYGPVGDISDVRDKFVAVLTGKEGRWTSRRREDIYLLRLGSGWSTRHSRRQRGICRRWHGRICVEGGDGPRPEDRRKADQRR